MKIFKVVSLFLCMSFLIPSQASMTSDVALNEKAMEMKIKPVRSIGDFNNSESNETSYRDQCSDTFAATGSFDLDGDGANDDCYTDGSGYFNLTWEGGCTALTIEWSTGPQDVSSLGFTEGVLIYGFDNTAPVTETFIITFNKF